MATTRGRVPRHTATDPNRTIQQHVLEAVQA